MKRHVLLIAFSALIFMAGNAFAKPEATNVVTISEHASFVNFDVAIDFVAPVVLSIEAPAPGILEVLPSEVIERPYAVALRQTRAPPDSDTIGYN